MSIDEQLRGMAETDYGDAYREHMLTMYRDFVASADDVSRRRQVANSFFLTINTAIVGLAAEESLARAAGGTVMLVVMVAAIVICLVWWQMIASYRSLNSAKFQVINDWEKALPARPYTAEWAAKSRADGAVIKTLTRVEAYVPWVFAVLHVLVMGAAAGVYDLALPAQVATGMTP